MKTARRSVILIAILLAGVALQGLANAQSAPVKDGTKCVVGHFTASLPDGWNSFSSADKAAARREFASDLAPGLRQYEKSGQPSPKMGDFVIFQKPPEGQLIGWTLVVPDQTDFLKEILKREDVQFERGKSLSGGRITAGSCKLVKLGGVDVVRVDVEMANGGKSTNLHFWSPKSPGVITTLMIGLRPGKSAQTEKEFDKMIASLEVREDISK
jgi:hypothetical protein